MRYFMSYGVALVLLLLIGGLLASGTLVQGGQGPGNGERPLIELFGVEAEPEATDVVAEVEPVEPEALQSVRVVTFEAEQMGIEVPLRGRTEANSTVSAHAETAGILEAVHVSKGQRVTPGDLLCTIDAGTRAARVAQAEASLAQAQLDFETNKSLREKGLAASNTANSFEVGLKAAQAVLDDAEAELERTEIRAEIGGLIQEPLANRGDMLSVGGPCATIVNLDPMKFIGQVPESRVGFLSDGLPADVVTVTGQDVSGTVSFISSTADAATRSFTVEIEVPNPSGAIRDGVTADAVIKVGTMMAHLLPQSVLTLENSGAVGIKTVEGDITHFQPVTLVRDTTEGVWVTGLPPSVDVITIGQEYVIEGQKVEATVVQKEASL